MATAWSWSLWRLVDGDGRLQRRVFALRLCLFGWCRRRVVIMYELDVIFVDQGSREQYEVLNYVPCWKGKTYQSNEFSKGADIMNGRYLHEE